MPSCGNHTSYLSNGLMSLAVSQQSPERPPTPPSTCQTSSPKSRRQRLLRVLEDALALIDEDDFVEDHLSMEGSQ